MAKAYTHKKITTEKITLKGLFDATTGTIDCDGEDINVVDKLTDFADEYVEITITLKSEEDLLLDVEE